MKSKLKKLFPAFRSDFQSTLKLAWPMIVSQISFVLMGAVDNIMIAKVSVTDLATAAFCNNVFSVILVTQMGLGSAIAPLIANSIGSKDLLRVGKQFRHGFILLLLFSIPLVAILLAVGYHVEIFGQSPEVNQKMWEYFPWLIACVPLVSIFQSYKQFFDGVESSMKPMQYLYLGIVFNIFFNWLFIYGHWGFPAWGLAGAGFATFLTRVILIFCLAYEAHFRGEWNRIYQLSFRNFTFEKIIWKRIVSLGLPSSFQYLCEVAAFSLAGIFAGQLGKMEIASHQISINLASFTFMAALGWSFATSIKIGNAMGEGDIKRCRRMGFHSLITVAVYMSFTALMFVLLKDKLALIYLDDPQIVEMVAQVLIIAALFQLADGLQAVGIGMLRGLQDVKVPTFITLVAYWVVSIPLARYLAFHTSLGLIGIWIALACGLYLSAFLLLMRFHRKTM